MQRMITVAVDVMGGDNAPIEIIKGAVLAVNKKNNIKVILVGPEDIIIKELANNEYNKNQIDIVDAQEIITNNDAPVMAIRRKKNSSIVKALNLVKNNDADAFVSAGSTGAILAGGQLIVGRIKGVERPPLTPVIPTINGLVLLADCGANVDARPSHLVQFAKMGSIYMENIMGIKNPRVAIVNIGEEEEKGNALVKETFPLLKNATNINFTGSIEARDIPMGAADVVVCDAFVGNVILKLYEGVGSAIIKTIKEGLMSTTRSKLGALLSKPALKETLKSFDYSKYGGAPLLGLNGLVVVTHGDSEDKQICNAILQCVAFTEQKINHKIKENLTNEE